MVIMMMTARWSVHLITRWPFASRQLNQPPMCNDTQLSQLLKSETMRRYSSTFPPPPPPPSRSTFLLPIPLRLIPIPGAGSPFLFKCDLIYSSQSLSEIPIACHQSRVNRFVKSLWSWSPAEILVSLPRYSGAAEAALVSLGRSFDTRMWLACHLEMDGGGYDACFLFSGQFWTENWCGAFPSVAQVDYSKLKAWRWPL